MTNRSAVHISTYLCFLPERGDPLESLIAGRLIFREVVEGSSQWLALRAGGTLAYV